MAAWPGVSGRNQQLGGHTLIPQQRNRLAIKRHEDLPSQPLPLMGDHPIGEIATGFQQRGSVSVAPNEERFEELKRGASMARVFGLPVDIITPADVKALVPLANVDDIVGAGAPGLS